jgi:hypothetical protein
MKNLPAHYEVIASKLEEVANDPASSRERIAEFLRLAAGLLRDVAAVLPAEINYGLDKIEPEGTA